MHTRNYSPSSFYTFLRNFNPMLRAKVMTIFPRSPVWNVIQESTKKTNFLRSYLCQYSAKSFEIRTRGSVQFCLKWVFFASETSQKKSYSENATLTYLEQRNPRIQSSDTKCYETSSRIDRKYRSTP